MGQDFLNLPAALPMIWGLCFSPLARFTKSAIVKNFGEPEWEFRDSVAAASGYSNSGLRYQKFKITKGNLIIKCFTGSLIIKDEIRAGITANATSFDPIYVL